MFLLSITERQKMSDTIYDQVEHLESYDLNRLNEWTEKEKLRSIKKPKLSKGASLFEQGARHRGYDLTLPDPNIEMQYGGKIEKDFDIADHWLSENDSKDSEIYTPLKKETIKIKGAKSLTEIITIQANQVLAPCSIVSFSASEKIALDKRTSLKLERDNLFSVIDKGLERIQRGKVLSANENNLNRIIFEQSKVFEKTETVETQTFPNAKTAFPLFDKAGEYLTQRGIQVFARDIRKLHRQLSIADSITISGMPITGFYSLLRKAKSQSERESLLRQREDKISGVLDAVLRIVLDKTISLKDVSHFHFEKDLKKMDKSILNKINRDKRKIEREAFKVAVNRDKKAMALIEKTFQDTLSKRESDKMTKRKKSDDKARVKLLFKRGYGIYAIAKRVKRKYDTIKTWLNA